MKLTSEEAKKNPILAKAIAEADAKQAAKRATSAQESRSMPQGVNPAYPLAKAKGRTRKTPGHMNKTEAQYALYLDAEKQAGRILEWYYEPFGLKLAPKTFWHPDFLVLTPGHFLELHECKGFMEDHANVKIKVAAVKFWWMTIYVVRKKPLKHGGGWERTGIKAA